MDWIGNVFIVIGLWFIGNKKRWAFIFSVIGESAWIIYSLTIGLYSLALICTVFAGLAVRSYWKWGKVSPNSEGKQ
jgi:nicotinamide riboside transporter PnuC